MKKAFEKKYLGVTIVVLNVILLAIIFMCYTGYTKAYEKQLNYENIGSVTNLNKSAAINASSLFHSCQITLVDLEQYIEKNNLTLDETLEMLTQLNSSGDRYYHLVGSDCKGKQAEIDPKTGTYYNLDYSPDSYGTQFKSIFTSYENETDNIQFVTEFTDSGKTGSRLLGIYKYVTLKNETEPWTLILAMKSGYVSDVINYQKGYEGQTTVLINSKGDFIVKSRAAFTSTNLYDYIRERNNLDLKERKAIEEEVRTNGNGELYYKKLNVSVTEDFVFRYEILTLLDMSDWYCVTCVPLSSFKAPDFNINYIIYIVLILLVIFAIDTLWMLTVNRRLNIAVKREKEASLAKGSFLSRMSHEIRTPLNAIIGYNTIARNELTAADNMEKRIQAEMKTADCLDKSAIASKHLLTIINDVLDMSAIESGKINILREKFDFKGMIASLTTVFYSQARSKDVGFEVIFSTLTDEWLVGDQMRTNQVLTNILSNAVKFTPEGGNVTMKISQTDNENGMAKIHFEIYDTGIGMKKEYLQHIWQPFEQADSSISRRYGGTGLGLSITKNLVDLMNGTITVDSDVGEGTVFNIDLDFGRTEGQIETNSCNFSNINALVVDDDQNTLDYIRLLFTRCGARCTTVMSGMDAVTAVRNAGNENRYTLCIVDWRMPGMDGFETIKEIKKTAGNELPIIMLTAYDYSEVADKAISMGIDRFISKPLFQSTLFDALVSINGFTHNKQKKAKTIYDFKGARVILAEDNVMNMEIAKNLMLSANLVVDSAWNGKEAVEMFMNSEPGYYKVVFMDIHMPELNGYDATRKIRSSAHPQAKSIPIIAMTADAFAENVSEALSAGMNAHISKPIDLATLFKTIDELLM